MKTSLDKIYQLIQSGEKVNIDLAFEIAKAEDISDDKLLFPYQNWLKFAVPSRSISQEDRLYRFFNAEVLELKFDEDTKETFDQLTLNFELPKLKELIILSVSALNHIPDWVYKLKNLKILDLEMMGIESLSEKLGQLEQLQMLNLAHNRITDLPKSLGQLKNLRQLYLNHNQIDEIRKDQFLNATALSELSLQFNEIKSLDSFLGLGPKLSILHLDNNKLESLPNDLGQLKQLEELILSNNRLKDFPSFKTGDPLPNLSILFITDNKLTEVFDRIKNLRSNMEISLAGNSLSEKEKAKLSAHFQFHDLYE